MSKQKMCKDAIILHFRHIFSATANLSNEVLYELAPVTVKKSIYENELPFIETLNIVSGEYTKQKYEIL